MVKIELNVTQLKRAIAQLPKQDRARLIRDLNRENWTKNMNQIFAQIDRRRKKHPISQKEITTEITAVRRKVHGPRRP